MSLFWAKSLFHQYPKTPSFPGVFLSGTRNPGLKILSRIGNTTYNTKNNYHKKYCYEIISNILEKSILNILRLLWNLW